MCGTLVHDDEDANDEDDNDDAKHTFSMCFPSVPMQNLRFLIVFHRFLCKTNVFLLFSMGSNATFVVSVLFPSVLT